MTKLIRIHPEDNILVVRARIFSGDAAEINGEQVIFAEEIGIGHKVAACLILQGEKIFKYGVPIGSATEDISCGGHVHLHNMKSDYLPTYTLDHQYLHV